MLKPHPPTPPTLVCGKTVFHGASPWGQKGSGHLEGGQPPLDRLRPGGAFRIRMSQGPRDGVFREAANGGGGGLLTGEQSCKRRQKRGLRGESRAGQEKRDDWKELHLSGEQGL